MIKAYKIVTFVPENYANEIRAAMGKAGAGKIGLYSFCSFSTKGIGRFKPIEGANPAIGTIGVNEQVEEERIEVVCERGNLESVLKAIRETHPYEEVPIDIYAIEIG